VKFTPTTHQLPPVHTNYTRARTEIEAPLICTAALELLKDLDKSNATATSWADHKWNMEWQKNTSLLHKFIPFPGSSPPETTLHRTSWVRLNRLRIGVGLFRSTMHKWGLVPSTNCKCGAEEQTADHILASCPQYHPPNGTLDLAALDDDTVDWLQTSELCI